MKVREGFVSNSSSTSFMIAVPKTVNKNDEPYLKLFEQIVEKLQTEDKQKYFNGKFINISEFKKSIKESINDQQNEILALEHYYNQIASFMADKNKMNAVNLFFTIVQGGRQEGFHEVLWRVKYPTKKDKPLSELQSDIQEAIKERQKKIADLTVELDSVEKYGDSKYMMTFNLEHHFKTNVEEALENLIDAGIVKLVKRVDS